uniref:Putative secreted peptide n=1 Tax=Anopheles braziliensis TaxID=58242 RepID=A0A2M3ZVC8_9DIPT
MLLPHVWLHVCYGAHVAFTPVWAGDLVVSVTLQRSNFRPRLEHRPRECCGGFCVGRVAYNDSTEPGAR